MLNRFLLYLGYKKKPKNTCGWCGEKFETWRDDLEYPHYIWCQSCFKKRDGDSKVCEKIPICDRITNWDDPNCDDCKDGETSGILGNQSEVQAIGRSLDTSASDSIPAFKDALLGIDVYDIRNVAYNSSNSYLRFKAIIELKEYKKIMEVETRK